LILIWAILLKLLDIVAEMTILNMELLKQHADPVRLAVPKTGGLKKQKKAREVEWRVARHEL
jgi:hypothetical protein